MVDEVARVVRPDQVRLTALERRDLAHRAPQAPQATQSLMCPSRVWPVASLLRQHMATEADTLFLSRAGSSSRGALQEAHRDNKCMARGECGFLNRNIGRWSMMGLCMSCRVYGSGYPGFQDRGVVGRGFPFWFWPLIWGTLLTEVVIEGAYLHEISEVNVNPIVRISFSHTDALDTRTVWTAGQLVPPRRGLDQGAVPIEHLEHAVPCPRRQ